MTASAATFKAHIEQADYILDPEGRHHEFVSGVHGRKLDFDKIPDGSELFGEWVEVNARTIFSLYPDIDPGRLVILGVARGTNRLAAPVAAALGDAVTALVTEKMSPKTVRLAPAAMASMRLLDPDLVVAIEDVGTAGTTAASAVISARAAGARRVEVLNTWQRTISLKRLIGIKAVYHSIIYEPLADFAPEVCRTDGYCAEGWELIPHGRS